MQTWYRYQHRSRWQVLPFAQGHAVHDLAQRTVVFTTQKRGNARRRARRLAAIGWHTQQSQKGMV